MLDNSSSVYNLCEMKEKLINARISVQQDPHTDASFHVVYLRKSVLKKDATLVVFDHLIFGDGELTWVWKT